ncbi:uncharacterized protein LOC123518199 isoform X2 [Portunus trituberculatus]|uniref:uncharacterized protein LOC123518199 isoform X2 n=1 Tax=Portunus trituberculatus TaxID=210409 RepID=UPI001E1D0B0D|nr:uncharacterized protein LOC123518199 isoform X2 [Portunus trituberculatus]
MNYGTQNVDTMATVPDRTTTTSVPCGIQTSNPKIGQESAGMCHSAAYGTVTINTSLIQGPESASGAAHTTQTHTTNTTKKRIRKRKKPEEMVKKTRKYEQGPLSDHLEERKRLDAIRAKRCRERNRNDVMALKEKLALVEEEKGAMAKEIAQREAYEGVLRKLLWEKTGIAVLPYASPSPSSSNKMALPQLQTTG